MCDFQFQLYGDATYEPIVFLKQPYLLQGSVSFGNQNDSTQLPLKNETRITFDVFANILNDAISGYGNISNKARCPREVLKFSPPPQIPSCDYRYLTALHNFGLNITFQNVSFRNLR